MAQMTGGVDIVNTNNFKGNYAKVARPTGPTYILTYSSPASQSDGRFHRIGVAVDRPDVTVQSKQGYYAFRAGGMVTPATPLPRGLSALAAAALEEELPRSGVGIALSAAAFDYKLPGASILVGIDIDSTQLNRSQPLEVAWAAVNEDGALSAAERTIIEPRTIARGGNATTLTMFKRVYWE